MLVSGCICACVRAKDRQRRESVCGCMCEKEREREIGPILSKQSNLRPLVMVYSSLRSGLIIRLLYNLVVPWPKKI